MPVMSDFEAQFGDLVMGNDSYDITSFDGLTMPDVRTSDVDRPQSDGQYAGIDYLKGRTFTISVDLWYQTRAEFGERLREIQTEFAPGHAGTFTTQMPGLGQISTECRVRRRHGPLIDLEAALGRARMTVEFHATDPRWYSVGSLSGTASLRSVTGGLEFPVSFPFMFGETETSGSLVSAVNGGTYESFPTVRIRGPVVSPSITNVTADMTLLFTGLTIGADDVLVVDLENRTVLLNGTSSRYSFLDDSAGWWALAPGVNEIRFGGTSTGAPSAAVEWRSAFV